MTSPSAEQLWRTWLDRLLILDVFLVIGGAIWFFAAALATSQGIKQPMELFQQLWLPLFLPAISLLMTAALINGVWSWWQRIKPQKGRDI